MISELFANFTKAYENPALTTKAIAMVLGAAALLSLYEWVVYRVVSHRAFYNRSFHITLAVLPLFIAAIIFSLQTDLLITLGTIGALAILRFRTAVKDPVDMLYLMWSVFNGIAAGCQLFELAVLTSLAATVLLLVLELLPLGKAPYVLLFRTTAEELPAVLETIRQNTRKSRVKSRNFTSKGVDCVVECTLKDPEKLTEALDTLGKTAHFSLVAYDHDDIL